MQNVHCKRFLLTKKTHFLHSIIGLITDFILQLKVRDIQFCNVSFNLTVLLFEHATLVSGEVFLAMGKN